MNELKKCRCCGRNRRIDDFYPTRFNKDGRVSYCKECSRKKAKVRAASRYFNPILDGVKKCRICGNEKSILEFGVAHHLVDGRSSECKVCANEKAKKKDRRATRIATKRWKTKNAGRLLTYQRGWRSKNLDHVRQDARERYTNDTDHRIAAVVRSRVHAGLRGRVKKSIRTEDLLGCSFGTLKVRLASMFVPGMTWGNYGEWHIDHIRPCASFDLTREDEQRKCFHFSNLQPLWAHDNLIKSAKMPLDILLT
jgi:hypothetical protein